MEQLPAEAPAQANPREAWLDAAVLTEPLVLRAWQPGDRLHPTGMQGSKKVSDLLTDQKLSLPDKRRVLLLCHGRAVCWVVGYRQAITLRAVTPGAPALRVRWHSEQLPPHPVLTPHGQ
jgi:tRNA(Ile)-lysidine synthase